MKKSNSIISKEASPAEVFDDEDERIKIAKEAPKIMETMTLEEYEQAIKV